MEPKIRASIVALKSTCKNVFGWHLLNTKSFLVSQITQQRAAAPVNNKRLCFCWPNLDQPPNIWAMFLGGLKPKTQWTIRHRALATIQSKNKCFMVSRLLQKLQTLLPFQFLLARLSFVSVLHLNCAKRCLTVIDWIEDQRHLSQVESTFRSLLKKKIEELIHSVAMAARQRGKITWATFSCAELAPPETLQQHCCYSVVLFLFGNNCPVVD